jgi:death on curing protein
MITIRPTGQPIFLTVEEATHFHAGSLAAWGGREGLRDYNLLDSAMSMARQGFGGSFVHAYPFGMAAAYGYHIAKNHPFTDGNKRTAFICMLVFLRKNGYAVELDDAVAAQRLMLDLIEQGRDKLWLAQQLESCCCPLPAVELRQFFQDVTLAEFAATIRSLGLTSDRREMLATLDEAAVASSLIRELQTLALARLEQNDVEGFKSVLQDALPLVALFRLAENAGYEW